MSMWKSLSCSTMGRATMTKSITTPRLVFFSQPRMFSSTNSEDISSKKAWPTTAVIGIGQLGAAVVCNLARNGVPTVLYDLHRGKNVPLDLQPEFAANEKAGKITWADSGALAAAQAQVVITALPKPEHVSAAMECENGVLEGMQAGTVWIDHSTTDFENTIRVKDLVEAKASHAIEAPLTGGMQILRKGKMVTLVGGDPEVLSRVEELIALSAPRIVRCGTFGHASIIKIFSNILCAVHDVAVGETLCVAKKAGLDMKLVFDAMRVSSGNSFCWETEVPRMLKGDYYPDFTAEMMHKDISLGSDLGRKYGVPLPMNAFIEKAYENAMDKYGRDSGSSIPCRMVEDAAGIRLNDASEDEGCSTTGTAVDINFPGNKIAPGSNGGAFAKWNYTTDLADGSYVIKHVGEYENPYLGPTWVRHAGADELVALRRRVQELEQEVATLKK